MDEWVRSQYRNSYCNKQGELRGEIDFDIFRKHLCNQRPKHIPEIDEIVKRLHIEVCKAICRPCPLDSEGKFKDPLAVCALLRSFRPDLNNARAKNVQKLIQMENVAAAMNKATKAASDKESQPAVPGDSISSWISAQYYDHAFVGPGFIGWIKFADMLVQKKPHEETKIRAVLGSMRKQELLENPVTVTQRIALQKKEKSQGGIQLSQLPSEPAIPPHQAILPKTTTLKPPSPSSSIIPQPSASEEQGTKKHDVVKVHEAVTLVPNDRPTSQMNSYGPDVSDSGVGDLSIFDSDDDDQLSYDSPEPDFSLMDHLLASRGQASNLEGGRSGLERDIAHAPLLSEELVAMHATNLVPQYGFLGSCADDLVQKANNKMFLNTNVPFSAFICGVQGSGKSHTTACMLENALIPSRNLGNLRSPMSALVFSYGEFSNGGSGFNVSEAAFLATAKQMFPGQRVKKITVLTSPSNPAIKKFYNQFSNINVIPFKLKAKNLDIGTLLTLMAVNEKSDVPLYMAKVESILRGIATESEDGVFDYDLFKQRLALEDFDPKQTVMLEMRLGLLESFLDKEGNVPEPKYRPGEVTIIDLSDPFVTPNTACILFKLGLERFMQSSAPAKMVVLDEAHKYMLNTPGSKVLNDHLKTLIRLQRHKGARVIISTQEPTVSTDLIALCSVTVVHRFTSPDWYAALKKHINAMDDDKAIMKQIESLETGEALVYSPNAVLGKNEDGSLRKAVGRLLRIDVRKRVTADGGESVMAV